MLLPRRVLPALLVHTGRQYEARANSWVDDVRIYERLSVAPVAELDAPAARSQACTGAGSAPSSVSSSEWACRSPSSSEIRAELAPTPVRRCRRPLLAAANGQAAMGSRCAPTACRITADAYEAAFAATRGGQQERDVLQRLAVEHMRGGGGSGWGVVTSGPGNYDTVLGSRHRPHPRARRHGLDGRRLLRRRALVGLRSRRCHRHSRRPSNATSSA